jgi:hypothetical protein
VPVSGQTTLPQSVFFVAHFVSLTQQGKFSVHVDEIVQPVNDGITMIDNFAKTL